MVQDPYSSNLMAALERRLSFGMPKMCQTPETASTRSSEDVASNSSDFEGEDSSQSLSPLPLRTPSLSPITRCSTAGQDQHLRGGLDMPLGFGMVEHLSPHEMNSSDLVDEASSQSPWPLRTPSLSPVRRYSTAGQDQHAAQLREGLHMRLGFGMADPLCPPPSTVEPFIHVCPVIMLAPPCTWTPIGETSKTDQLACEDGENLQSQPCCESSAGSLGHPYKCCAPCKYAAKKRGCKDGAKCTRCHLCVWKAKEAKKQR